MSCQTSPYKSLNKSTGEIESLRRTERDREKVPEKGRKAERDTKCYREREKERNFERESDC